MTLLRSIVTVGGLTLLSRITGFARDVCIANGLGAGALTDAFLVAFRFPNLFRRLFAEGAFAAGFTPLFSTALQKDGPEEARRFANSSFSLLALVVTPFTALMMVTAPWAMLIFAPGFADDPGKLALTIELSRLTAVYLLFISLCAVVSGVLNAIGKFAAAATTPIILNLVLAGSALWLARFTETPAHALAWGVSFAGILQLAWLLLAIGRTDFRPRLVRPRLTPPMKTLLMRIAPAAFGAGLYQVNLLIDTILASLISGGAVSYLYYAERVTQFPLGVVGMSAGVALLPALSRRIAARDIAGALNDQNRAIEFSLLLILPAAVGSILLAKPIITILFQRGSFTSEDTAAVSAAFSAFSLGLPAYSLVKVLTPAFFAREDTKTPVKISAIALANNFILNLVLMHFFGHVGIALGSALANCLNAVLLLVVLTRRNHYRWDKRLRRFLPRLVASVGVMAIVTGGVRYAGALCLMPEWLMLAVAIMTAVLSFAVAVVATGAVRWSSAKYVFQRCSCRVTRRDTL